MKTKFNGILTLLLALVVQFTFAQERTISGVVSDEVGPVADIAVKVKGTTKGTVTDFDGKYSISAKTGDVLQFSHISYEGKEKTVGASNTINLTMEMQGNILEAVVIEAYSNKTIPAAKSTAAITTVVAETIEDRPNASIIQMLQGQVSGLNIGTGSGQPGANSTIILRGIGSINGNIEPLFIVDGVPVDEDRFRGIDNADIATVSILKDASASSLYGSRGANGAIVITTKRGKFNSPLQVGYKSQFGISVLPNPGFKVMNSTQKLNFDRDNNEGLGAGLTDAEIAATARFANVNWGDIVLQTGFTQSHNLNLTSGSDKTTSYTSLGYFEQEGVTRRSLLRRFTFRNNFNAKSDDGKFSFGTNFTANFSKSDFIQNEGQGFLSNPFLVAYLAKPYFSPYNLDGSLNIIGGGSDTFANTPYTSLNSTILNTNSDEELKMIASINGSYEFAKNLTASVRFGMDYTQLNSLNITHPEGIIGSQFNESGNAAFQGSHFESFSRDVRLNNVVSLNYSKVFNDTHTIDVTLFTEYSKSNIKTNSLQAFGLDPRLVGNGASFVSSTTFEDFNGDGIISGPNELPYIPSVGSGETNLGMFSYFGVAKYDYKERYGLQASVRRDASSRFSNSNKWATFYSASLRWNIHNEDFMKDNNFFNNLKLRASYGTSGNDRITGAYYGAPFRTFSTYAQGTGYNGTVGLFLSQIANKDLKWETSVQTNIGLDFGIKNNKIRGSIDVYKKTTEDLFQSQPISSLNGSNSISANIGDMENTGIEASVNWRAIKKNGFKLEFFANGSYNKNKITKLPNGNDIPTGRTILAEGTAIGTFYVVRWAGVNPENGNNLYLDINGNLTENYSNDDRIISDKSQYPVYQGGFGFNTSYKGFSLNTQFSFVADIYRYNNSLGVIEDPTLTGLANSSVTLLDAWQQTGDITTIPSLNTSSIRNLLSDKYLEDASYLRLRNISLGYSLGKKMLPSDFIVDNIKVFVQAENLFTWSKYRGWDPESNFRAQDFFNFPTPKIITLGFEVKF
jgi:TonB-linked SusC/RagA family outer membrane protein